MTITSSTFSPVSFANPFPAGTGLSDDVLLTYCQSRIGGIDTQINTQFVQQQNIQNATTAVNNASNLLLAAAAPKPGMTLGQLQSFTGQLQAACSQLDPSTQQAQEIQAQLTSLTNMQNKFGNPMPPGTDTGQIAVLPADCTTIGNALGGAGKDLSSEAEMQMMTLQSLVTQRQTAVQMCTNMMSSLGDTQKSVAEKIGS